METPESKRCPICGQGRLVDITFREGPQHDAAGEEIQTADTRQVETYSCGHEVLGPRLDETAAGTDELQVERRESDETGGTP
jgi:uncharacterized protein (DUF983 family)